MCKNLAFVKKTEKRRKLSQDTEESLVLRPSSPRAVSPALLSPTVVHDVSANPSIADYPQMARLRGTIKEKVASNAHRNRREQELFTLYWIARKTRNILNAALFYGDK